MGVTELLASHPQDGSDHEHGSTGHRLGDVAHRRIGMRNEGEQQLTGPDGQDEAPDNEHRRQAAGKAKHRSARMRARRQIERRTVEGFSESASPMETTSPTRRSIPGLYPLSGAKLVRFIAIRVR